MLPCVPILRQHTTPVGVFAATELYLWAHEDETKRDVCGVASVRLWRLPLTPGDFGAFLTETLKSHGANLRKELGTNSGLPTHWRAKPDECGIIILAPLESFSALDSLLRTALGEPQIWCDRNLDGGRQGVYGPTQIGCMIQYVECEAQTQIVILRKRSGGAERSVADDAPRAAAQK